MFTKKLLIQFFLLGLCVDNFFFECNKKKGQRWVKTHFYSANLKFKYTLITDYTICESSSVASWVD